MHTNGVKLPQIPVDDGPLLTKEDLAADFKVSLRQIDIFEEQGKIRFFKMGRLRRTTQGERNRFVQELIRAESTPFDAAD